MKYLSERFLMLDVNSGELTVALHVHTNFSACSESRPESIDEYCRERGIDVVGITDHDTIAGAQALKSVAKWVRVIVGEEIRTKQGEIVGLFLEEEIDAGLSARETCQRIKDQGGLVYIPHPFDPTKIHRLKYKALMDVMEFIDIIEIFNAKLLTSIFNGVAAKFARSNDKIGAVGSDAHYLKAIDLCVNRIARFASPAQFLENMKNAQLNMKRGGPIRGWWVGIKNVLVAEGHHVKRFGRK